MPVDYRFLRLPFSSCWALQLTRLRAKSRKLAKLLPSEVAAAGDAAAAVGWGGGGRIFHSE